MRVKIEGARIIYRNFSGKATVFKPEGNKTFCVVLDKANAERMAADGWLVKCKVPNTGDDDKDLHDAEELCHIEVTVGYKLEPPKVVVITDTSRTQLTEETIGMLDWAEIRNVDLIFQSYNWEFAGKTGVKAYLKSMFVTIEEDELDRKYAIEEMRTNG
jgi:hypothetical protein